MSCYEKLTQQLIVVTSYHMVIQLGDQPKWNTNEIRQLRNLKGDQVRLIEATTMQSSSEANSWTWISKRSIEGDQLTEGCFIEVSVPNNPSSTKTL